MFQMVDYNINNIQISNNNGIFKFSVTSNGIVKGTGRHANWVEVLDIRTKILSKKSHVLEVEGLNKTEIIMAL